MSSFPSVPFVLRVPPLSLSSARTCPCQSPTSHQIPSEFASFSNYLTHHNHLLVCFPFPNQRCVFKPVQFPYVLCHVSVLCLTCCLCFTCMSARPCAPYSNCDNDQGTKWIRISSGQAVLVCWPTILVQTEILVWLLWNSVQTFMFPIVWIVIFSPFIPFSVLSKYLKEIPTSLSSSGLCLELISKC